MKSLNLAEPEPQAGSNHVSSKLDFKTPSVHSPGNRPGEKTLMFMHSIKAFRRQQLTPTFFTLFQNLHRDYPHKNFKIEGFSPRPGVTY